MRITGNLKEILGKPSKEFLGKFSAEKADLVKEQNEKKEAERKKLINSYPKDLTKDQLEERNQEIQKKLDELVTIPDPAPLNILGDEGSIVSKHQSKLAYVIIGNSEKAQGKKVNAPKISLAVGGGLESTYDPKEKKIVPLDFTKDHVLGLSAQLHLVSLTDIKVDGILNISELKNRSAIKTDADVLDLSAGEIVIIRSLGRPYKASGARTMTPGGVHIVAGQKEGGGQYRDPEPMVLGKALSDSMFEIVTKISDINQVLLSMNNDILALKIALLSHVHPVPIGPVPVLSLPSVDLAISVAPEIASKTVLNIANSYSNLINLELLKLNNLTPLSENKFLSDYNRVN